MGARLAGAGCLATTLLLAACATNPEYPGPRTDRTALLNVRADGIYAHPEYPDDVVWARLYHSGSSKVVGVKKLTVEQPMARFALDAEMSYLIEFVSTEAQSGGYSNCMARTELQPLEGSRYVLTYRTAKSSCRIDSSRLDTQTGRYTKTATANGVVGAVPAQTR